MSDLESRVFELEKTVRELRNTFSILWISLMVGIVWYCNTHQHKPEPPKQEEVAK